jgi:CDP-diacylglycerol--serine O-phosphatidyltransferase
MHPAISSMLFWQQALTLILPLLVGGVLHMLVVRFDWLRMLKIPLHERSMGANKTWRGIVVMPILTVLGVMLARLLDQHWQLELLTHAQTWSLGLALGLGYVIPELPNSWMKRRMGIRPGESSSRYPWLFGFIDQTDSAFGCLLVYALWGIGHETLWIVLFFFGAVVHVVVNLILWSLGLRKQPL